MDKRETHQKFDHLSRGQIEVYARELQSHFQRERNLRQDLEQRHRELSALNRMFQEHLRQRFAGVGTRNSRVNSLRRISLETTAVIERAEREPLPGGKLESD
jgi:uncharacterized protein YlxW (UPF0749 family)